MTNSVGVIMTKLKERGVCVNQPLKELLEEADNITYDDHDSKTVLTFAVDGGIYTVIYTKSGIKLKGGNEMYGTLTREHEED